MQPSLVRGLTAGLSLSVLLGSSLCGQDITQRDGPPRADTPRILVATFHSSDPQLGIQAAAEIRRAVANEYSAKELFVVPVSTMDDQFHGQSDADSTPGFADLTGLAWRIHAEEVIGGTLSRTAPGIRLDARLFIRMTGEMEAQSLPAVSASGIRDAARQLVREVSIAREMLPSYHACLNAVWAGKYGDAIDKARQDIARYPNSTFSRVCMLHALVAMKGSPDSIITVARAILDIDSTSVFSLDRLAYAYAEKGDTASAIAIAKRRARFGPSRPIVIDHWDESNKSMSPSRALPIIDSLLVLNPGDPSILRTKWLLELRAKQYKQAIATGEELAAVDTAVVTRDYFQRMIGAAQSDSNVAAVQQFAAEAAQKFPKDPSFPLLLAQSYRKAGQPQQALQAAERATQIDPKKTTAWLFAITIADEMNQPDTLLALAKQAVAAGANKDTLSQSILGPAGAAIKKAQDSGARDDWMAALSLAQETDQIIPSPRSKNLVAVAAVQIAASIIDDAQTHAKSPKKGDRAMACGEAKRGSDMLDVARLALPSGDGDSTAAVLVVKVQRYDQSIEPLKKRCGIVH